MKGNRMRDFYGDFMALNSDENSTNEAFNRSQRRKEEKVDLVSIEYAQDLFDKQAPISDIYGAPPDVTVPTVISHIRNLYDHMKRVVDWVNEASKEHKFSTRLELKHNFSGLSNEYAKPQAPDAVDIFLHADPYLINLEKLTVYIPEGQNKIGFGDDLPRTSAYKDADGFIPKRMDGQPLEYVIISHINLSDTRRQLQANEFQYSNPLLQQGAEMNAGYYVKMIRENLVASVFSKLPIYELPDGMHVNQSRVIQDYIYKKIQTLAQKNKENLEAKNLRLIEKYNNRRPFSFDHTMRYG
jgi:hypothetical protein